MQIRIILGVGIPSISIILYLLGNYWVKFIPLQLFDDEKVNHMLKFQIFGLMLSVMVLGLTLTLAPESKKLLTFGNLNNLSQPVKLLGIKATDTWQQTGLSYLLVITITTAAFMYMGLADKVDWSKWLVYLPFIITFSLVNSFNEEIITRFSVVGFLDGYLKPSTILLAAALIFGLPHYFGNPGGPMGILMAGFLGWLLAKATLETQGIGIAWGVHFVQDLVIYSFILLLNSDTI